MQGVVKFTKLEKGFGFIKPSDGTADLFFHVSALAPGMDFDERLQNRSVRFDVQQSDRGPRAVNITGA